MECESKERLMEERLGEIKPAIMGHTAYRKKPSK